MKLLWLFKMAWRDSRRNRSRLLLFMSSIILGVAALVAIYSLGDNMRDEVDNQAATLLGADLRVSTNKSITPQAQSLLDSIEGKRSEERSFASMIYFVKNGGTRLVQVKAIDGEYPYYGELKTSPAGWGVKFRQQQAAIVDETLMLQYGATPGDSIRIGEVTFVIAASLTGAPGETGFAASVAPKVYIPLQYLEQTGLSQKGSRINTTFYYKFQKTIPDIDLFRLTVSLGRMNLNYDTIETQKEDTSRSLGDLTNFLSLVSFIALLLGCIGVASAIHIYVREKISAIAILRCLGVKGSHAFLIYLIQIIIIGFIGSLIGAGLGIIIQQFLPMLLKDAIPIQIRTTVSWSAILQGIALGVIISFLFALLPLINIRRISPLNTLRLSYQQVTAFRDPWKLFIYFLIILFIFVFSSIQLRTLNQAMYFTLGVIAAFLILVGIASLLMWTVRKFFPTSWSYLWRQGLANLYRPNNQTTILIVAIGLGTAFICTLFSIQSVLLNRVTLSAAGNQSNTVLFDIQSSQKDSVVLIAKQQNLPVHGVVPIVNMRLEKLNGLTQKQTERIRLFNKFIKKEGANDTATMEFGRAQLFGREYRVTFRDTLIDTEKITAGKWQGTPDAAGTIYISVEERYAKRNNLKIGDKMEFNVQGALISTVIGSLREVDFNRISTNFLVVFPKGVLETAPQFHVLLTRVDDKAASARFQQAVVQQYPNVSIIDLGLVLKTLNELFEKIAFIIRFIAGFSILTGLIVLIASVLTSKYQRIRESVLLRTIGASRKQIFYITAIEYFLLGALAALTGILLSLAFSWGLAEFIFDSSYKPEWLSLLAVFFSISFLTVAIGLMNSREVVRKSPLEVLRSE